MEIEGQPSAVAPSLEELLRSARDADLSIRVRDYRDAIASFGSAGIARLEDWLADSRDAYFAVTVIERAGTEFGCKIEAIRALRKARRAAVGRSLGSFIDAALARLGARTPAKGSGRSPRSPIPTGFQVAPPYRAAHHVVVDYVPESGTRWHDIYLFACGRFFSGGWVRKRGGLKDPAGLLICDRCSSAVERGA